MTLLGRSHHEASSHEIGTGTGNVDGAQFVRAFGCEPPTGAASSAARRMARRARRPGTPPSQLLPGLPPTGLLLQEAAPGLGPYRELPSPPPLLGLPPMLRPEFPTEPQADIPGRLRRPAADAMIGRLSGGVLGTAAAEASSPRACTRDSDSSDVLDFATVDLIAAGGATQVGSLVAAAAAAAHHTGRTSVVLLTELGPLAAAPAGPCELDLPRRPFAPMLGGVPAAGVPPSLEPAPPLPFLPCGC